MFIISIRVCNISVCFTRSYSYSPPEDCVTIDVYNNYEFNKYDMRLYNNLFVIDIL